MFHVFVEDTSSELSDTAYEILKVLSKETDFLHDTIETSIKEAERSNKTELVSTWQTIKNDRIRHIHLLKKAIKKEIEG